MNSLLRSATQHGENESHTPSGGAPQNFLTRCEKEVEDGHFPFQLTMGRCSEARPMSQAVYAFHLPGERTLENTCHPHFDSLGDNLESRDRNRGHKKSRKIHSNVIGRDI
jgi:hypothetical protein